MKLARKLNQRQWCVCVAVGTLIVVGVLFRYLLIPAGHEWIALRSQLRANLLENTRLLRNVAMKQQVDEAFARLGSKAYQRESDPITLAGWLQELEMLGRLPGMALNHMKAMPVKQEGQCRVYRVRVSVSGKLPEVLRFVSRATQGETIAGLESFALRGMQGPNMVECSLLLRMIRLLPGQGETGAIPSAVADKGEGIHGR